MGLGDLANLELTHIKFFMPREYSQRVLERFEAESAQQRITQGPRFIVSGVATEHDAREEQVWYEKLAEVGSKVVGTYSIVVCPKEDSVVEIASGIKVPASVLDDQKTFEQEVLGRICDVVKQYAKGE